MADQICKMCGGGWFSPEQVAQNIVAGRAHSQMPCRPLLVLDPPIPGEMYKAQEHHLCLKCTRAVIERQRGHLYYFFRGLPCPSVDRMAPGMQYVDGPHLPLREAGDAGPASR